MAYRDMVRPENIEAAIWSTLLAIHGQAVDLAPVDQGALRNSISMATNKREAGFNASSGENAPIDAKIARPESANVGYVGTAIVYGAAVEFGRPDMERYPAQPYLRPAARLVRSKLDKTFSKTLEKEIMDMARKQYPFRKDK